MKKHCRRRPTSDSTAVRSFSPSNTRMCRLPVAYSYLFCLEIQVWLSLCILLVPPRDISSICNSMCNSSVPKFPRVVITRKPVVCVCWVQQQHVLDNLSHGSGHRQSGSSKEVISTTYGLRHIPKQRHECSLQAANDPMFRRMFVKLSMFVDHLIGMLGLNIQFMSTFGSSVLTVVVTVQAPCSC